MSSQLGPSVMGTLVTADGAALAAAYCDFLYQEIAASGRIEGALADAWRLPGLAGLNYWLLQNQLGYQWLRIIEDPTCSAPTPLRRTGWMALEVSVQDVDARLLDRRERREGGRPRHARLDDQHHGVDGAGRASCERPRCHTW